jgi:hypothetical protein
VNGSGTLARLAAGLGLSVALHWGALQAIGGVPAVPQGRGVPVADTLSARVVWATSTSAAEDVARAVSADADTDASGRLAGRTAATPSAGSPGIGVRPPPASQVQAYPSGRDDAASRAAGKASAGTAALETAGSDTTAPNVAPADPSAPNQSASDLAVVSSPAAARAASMASAAGGASLPRPFEMWELDRPPEFLYPPLGLDALPAQAQRRIDAVVSLFIDAFGRLIGLEVRDEAGTAVPTDLVEAIRDAFEPVSFLPGTLDGRAVPAVQRFEMRIDPKAPLQLGFRLAN